MSDDLDDDGNPIAENDPRDAGDALNPAKPLANARHEKAVQLLLSGMTQTEAAAQAGFQRGWQNASRMFRIPAIKDRIAYLKAEEANRAAEERAIQRMQAGYKKDQAMIELEGARALAMTEKRPSAAVAAIVAKCKVEGLIRDVLPLAPPDLANMTMEQLEQYFDALGPAEPRRVATPVAEGSDQGPRSN